MYRDLFFYGRIKNVLKFQLDLNLSFIYTHATSCCMTNAWIKLNNYLSLLCFVLTYLLHNNTVRICVFNKSQLQMIKIRKEALFLSLSKDNTCEEHTLELLINLFLLQFFMSCCLLTIACLMYVALCCVIHLMICLMWYDTVWAWNVTWSLASKSMPDFSQFGSNSFTPSGKIFSKTYLNYDMEFSTYGLLNRSALISGVWSKKRKLLKWQNISLSKPLICCKKSHLQTV